MKNNKLNFMRKVAFFILIFCCTGVFSQKAKAEGVYVSSWQIPKVVIPAKLSTYSVAEITENPNIKVFIDKDYEAKPPTRIENFKNDIVEKFLRKIRLRQFKHVESGGDLNFKVVRNSITVFLKAEKKKSNRSSEPDTYDAKIMSDVSIELQILDNQGAVITTIKEKGEGKLIDRNDQSESKAKEYVLKEFKKNDDKYLNSALSNHNQALHNLLEKIIKEIDYTLAKERMNLFIIKKAEKYKAEKVNELVTKLQTINNNSFYPEDTEFMNSVKEVIVAFEKLLPNFDEKDKKQKRVVWAILSNISACHYMLQDYKTAVSFATKRETLKYKKRYVYNKEMASHKLEVIAKYDANPNKRDKKTYNFYMGVDNAEGYNATIGMAYKYISYFADVFFVKEASIGLLLTNPAFYQDFMHKKVKLLKRKKKKFFDREILSEMITYANNNNNLLFYDKYSRVKIRENLKDIDSKVDELCDFYNASGFEKKLFVALIKKASDTFLQYNFDDYKSNKELNKELADMLLKYEFNRYGNERRNYGDVIYSELMKEINSEDYSVKEYSQKELIKYIRGYINFASGLIDG